MCCYDPLIFILFSHLHLLIYAFFLSTNLSISFLYSFIHLFFFINDLPVVIASKVRYSFSSVQLSLEIKKKWQIILSVHPTMNMMLLKTFSRGEVKVPSHLWQLKLPQTEQYWMNSISGQWKEIWMYNTVRKGILKLHIQLNFITNLVNFQMTRH